MAEVAFPLDSDIIGYDGGLPVYSEQYGSQALRDVFKRFFSTGVFGEDMLQVVKTTDKPAGEDTIVSVTINPGAAIINGGIYTNDAPVVMTKTVPLATSSQTQVVKKYHVVLGFEKPATQTERFYRVLKETYDDSAYEDLTRTSTKYEIALATITARAVYQNGQSKCTVTVQDRRLDTDYCGLAVPFREFDSSAFGAELASMASELQRQTDIAVEVSQNAIDGTTAGELTQKLDAIKSAALLDDGTEIIGGNIAIKWKPGNFFIRAENISNISGLPSDITDSDMRLYVMNTGVDESGKGNVMQLLFTDKKGGTEVSPTYTPDIRMQVIHKLSSSGGTPSGWVKLLSESDTGWKEPNSSFNGIHYRIKNGIMYLIINQTVNLTASGQWVDIMTFPEEARPSTDIIFALTGSGKSVQGFFKANGELKFRAFDITPGAFAVQGTTSCIV